MPHTICPSTAACCTFCYQAALEASLSFPEEAGSWGTGKRGAGRVRRAVFLGTQAEAVDRSLACRRFSLCRGGDVVARGAVAAQAASQACVGCAACSVGHGLLDALPLLSLLLAHRVHRLLTHRIQVHQQLAQKLSGDARANAQLALWVDAVLVGDDSYGQLARHDVQLPQVQIQVVIVVGVVLGAVVYIWDLGDVERALLLAVEALEQLAPSVKHEQHALPAAWFAGLQLPLCTRLM
mmetsp:Transcript_9356/g.25211  ORF Transcript_9356/g.25211 Transcript_9356/m.25211 type:complete len:238 (-) Transcript_9356:2772-3485(-)